MSKEFRDQMVTGGSVPSEVKALIMGLRVSKLYRTRSSKCLTYIATTNC